MARGGSGEGWPISSRRPDSPRRFYCRASGPPVSGGNALVPQQIEKCVGLRHRQRTLWAEAGVGGGFASTGVLPASGPAVGRAAAGSTCCTAPGRESLNIARASLSEASASAVSMTTTCWGAMRSKVAARRPQWPRGFLAEIGGEGLGDGVGAVEILRLAGEKMQGRQVGDHHGVGVGGGVVVGAAHAHDDVGGIVGGEGVAAGVGDPEMPVQRGGPALGGGEVGRIVGGLIEAQRAPRSCWRSRWRCPAPWPGRRDRSGRGGRPSPCAGGRKRRRWSRLAANRGGRTRGRRGPARRSSGRSSRPAPCRPSRGGCDWRAAPGACCAYAASAVSSAGGRRVRVGRRLRMVWPSQLPASVTS